MCALLLLTMTQGSENFSKMDIKESIHSGHFMVSDIDDSEAQDDDDSVAVQGPVSQGEQEEEADQQQLQQQPPDELSGRGYDFQRAIQQTSKTYIFGPRSCKSVSIDATLTKLFQCMTLAYRGKLTSPRWKNFKGLKLRWKDKIRLNNVIWRAWHMQFVERRNTVVCQFQVPLESEAHVKPEAVVLEGKYWKRQLETVRAEYKSWRLYRQRYPRLPGYGRNMGNESFEYNYEWQPRSNQSAYSCSMIVDDDPFNEFSDTLFSCLIPNQPFAFPNPREIARAGIADFIQPGLLPFQPNLDDCMDTFDWFSDIFSSRLPPVAEEPESSLLADILDGSGPSTSQAQQNGFGYFGLDALMPSMQGPSNHPSTSRAANPFRVKNLSGLRQNSPTAWSSLFGSDKEGAASAFSPTSLEAAVAMDTCNGEPKLEPAMVPSTSLDAVGMTINIAAAKQQQQQPSPVASPGLFSLTPPPPPSDCLYVGHTSPTHCTQPPLQMTMPVPQLEETPPLAGPLPPTPPSPVLLPTPTSPHHALPMQPAHKYVNILPSYPMYSPKNLTDILLQPSLIPTPGGVPSPSPPPPTPPVSQSEAAGRRLSADNGKGIARAEKDDSFFLVPKVRSSGGKRSKPRARSRSGPSLGQLMQPRSARSSPPAPISTAVSTSSIHSIAVPPVHIAPSPVTVSSTVVPTGMNLPSVMPQSALLAQLLSAGTYSAVDKANTNNTSSPATVAILPNSSSSQQAVVITPVTLSTMSSVAAAVNDLQSRVLVGATSQVFSGFVPQGKMALPPISSTVNCITKTMTTNSVNQGSEVSEAADVDGGVASPPKPFRPKSETERVQYKEHRRVCHINAEQKRRCNIKNGFDTLHHLVPSLGQNPNGKISKAAMLQKAGEYIKQLKGERSQLHEEAVQLKKQIEGLNQAINVCQSQLPATGAPVPCQRQNKIQKMFEEYVRNRTLQNWKFWIFSILIHPLLESYNNTVSTANMDDLCKTVLTWLEQHCSLVALRPGVFNSLKHLSTTTNILSDPMQIQEEAARAVRLQQH